MSDGGFWGWMKQATAIAGELLPLLLAVAEPETAGAPAKRRRTAIKLSDEEECGFQPNDSKTGIELYNNLNTLTCVCTFSSNDGATVSVTPIVVDQHHPADITAILNEYVPVGGYVALDTAATAGSSVPAGTMVLRSFPLGEPCSFNHGDLTFEPGVSGITVTNASTSTSFTVKTSFNFDDEQEQFSLAATALPNQPTTIGYPDNVMETWKVVDTLTISFSAVEPATP